MGHSFLGSAQDTARAAYHHAGNVSLLIGRECPRGSHATIRTLGLSRNGAVWYADTSSVPGVTYEH
jgi:hypothetical protein